jgi:hypothetical protein
MTTPSPYDPAALHKQASRFTSGMSGYIRVPPPEPQHTLTAIVEHRYSEYTHLTAGSIRTAMLRVAQDVASLCLQISNEQSTVEFVQKRIAALLNDPTADHPR